MKKEDPPVVVEEVFDSSINQVWEAITDKDKMVKWFFDNIPDFKPEVGFKVSFNVNSGERDFLHLWEIIEVIPIKKIKYNWKYQDYKGDSNLTMELKEENGKTKITVTSEVLESFDDSIPEFKRESCIGGWNYFIKESLKNYLK